MGLGVLLTAGSGISLEDSGRVVFDFDGGIGAGVALIGGGGVSIDNGTTPDGLSNQTSGLMGQIGYEWASAGVNFNSTDLSDPNFVTANFGAGIGPKLGGLVGFTKGGARGTTLADLQCDGR